MDRKMEALRTYRAEYEKIRDRSKSMRYTKSSAGRPGLLALIAPAPSKK